MFDTPAKRVREDVARARAALGKGNALKSLEHFVRAVDEFKDARIFGREKFEAEVHIQEYLKDFNRHPDVKKHFADKNIHVTPYVAYNRGGEAALLESANKVLAEMRGADKAEEQIKEAKQEHRKEELLEMGRSCLEAKEFPKGKSVLRRLVEEFGSEPGLKTEVGRMLLKAGLYFEAGEALEDALLDAPRDSKALSGAIQAYKHAGEYTKMEMLYKHALKTFGAHPKTLLHMAEMYVKWHKWDEAYDTSKQAYDGDSSLDKAKEIMDSCARRIFR
ncbi:hypothetical protein [Desulfocurvus sp. DL9XJH121]